MTAISTSPCDAPLYFAKPSIPALPLTASLIDMWLASRQLRALRRQQRDCGCGYTDSAPTYPQERQSLILSGGFIPLAR